MVRINLIPSEYIEREKKKAHAGIIGAIAGILFLVIGGMTGSLILKKNNLAKQIKTLDARIQELEAVAREVDALEAKKRDIEAKNGAIGRLLVGRFDYPKLMEALVTVLPSGQVAFGSLGLRPASGGFDLNVQANATSVESLIRLIERLESTPGFSNIVLGSISYNPDGTVSFPVNFSYRFQ